MIGRRGFLAYIVHRNYSNAVYNDFHIQTLPENLRSQLFGKKKFIKSELHKKHFEEQGMQIKKSAEIKHAEFNPPKLLGFEHRPSNIATHFEIIAHNLTKDYRKIADEFYNDEVIRSLCKKRPSKWSLNPGWTWYENNTNEIAVHHPPCDAMVFKSEKCTDSLYPITAVALSKKGWYSWISPDFLEEKSDLSLVPVGDFRTPRLIFGHLVSASRIHLKEEYSFRDNQIRFIDVTSLHQASFGQTSKQETANVEKKGSSNEDESFLHLTTSWDTATSLSSIEEIVKLNNFYQEISERVDAWIDTEELENRFQNFKHPKLQDLRTQSIENLNLAINGLINNAAIEVGYTFLLLEWLYESYVYRFKHPASFCGMLAMGKCFLPTSRKWSQFIERCDAKYFDHQKEVQERLQKLVLQTLSKPEPHDPWLSQLDWEKKVEVMTKPKYNAKGELKQEARPKKGQNMDLINMPKWYEEVYDKSSATKLSITATQRITSLLLKLCWDGFPICFKPKIGWVYFKEKTTDEKLLSENNDHWNSYLQKKSKAMMKKKDKELDGIKDIVMSLINDNEYLYYRIPSESDESSMVMNLLSKSFYAHFLSGRLSSKVDQDLLSRIFDGVIMFSFWKNYNSRAKEQLVVYRNEEHNLGIDTDEDVGIILPGLITMGTTTRRAVEPTWMTACEAKVKSVGTEMKSRISVPKGFKFVGADVDSEELWIAGLLGDSAIGDHGSTALGWSVLQGTKNDGTDLHSRTAKIINTGRDIAKVFNYARIYGAGAAYATTLLMKYNPTLSKEDATSLARKLYLETKGKVCPTQKKRQDQDAEITYKSYLGGSESVMFSELEYISNAESPKTPFLQGLMCEGLRIENDPKGQFSTSRNNWVVQSSAVDYLHLLLTSMDYLIKAYEIDARLCITIHDEVRYFASEKDAYRCGLALQISNLWTRSFFSFARGLRDLPYSVAFFSSVDIDHVLRKEPSYKCISPTQPDEEAPGKSMNIHELLQNLGNEEIFGSPNLKAVNRNFDIQFESKLDNSLRTEETLLEHSGEKPMTTRQRQLFQQYIRNHENKKVVKEVLTFYLRHYMNFFNFLVLSEILSPALSLCSEIRSICLLL